MGHISFLLLIIFGFCYLTPKLQSNEIFGNKKSTLFPYSENSLSKNENLPSRAIPIYLQIKNLNPKISDAQRRVIADSIYRSSVRYEIPAEIMVAIIMTESSFIQKAVSTTGDISIAQINYEVWEKEAARIGFELSREKLISSSDYAIDRMGLILFIIKNNFSETDPVWYGRYHSQTSHFKAAYLEKVHKFMNINSDLIADNSSF